MGASHRSEPLASRSVGGLSDQRNIRVNVEQPSRRPSIYSEKPQAGISKSGSGGEADGSDDSSDDDLFKRNKRGKR